MFLSRAIIFFQKYNLTFNLNFYSYYDDFYFYYSLLCYYHLEKKNYENLNFVEKYPISFF